MCLSILCFEELNCVIRNNCPALCCRYIWSSLDQIRWVADSEFFILFIATNICLESFQSQTDKVPCCPACEVNRVHAHHFCSLHLSPTCTSFLRKYSGNYFVNLLSKCKESEYSDHGQFAPYTPMRFEPAILHYVVVK
ncbi:hypothetical protein Q3G72_024330 [Acer saccharum]|nr:hypothetical protein Q3G72_024330 [Acer saccharum]